jgi:hypothetical protein
VFAFSYVGSGLAAGLIPLALGQVFSEYFGFPCQSLFHHLLHSHHHVLSGVGVVQ